MLYRFRQRTVSTVLEYALRTYNLGQNKWNIWTTPPPHFNDAKMARFALRASSSLLRGGGGLIVPFYTVQDCNLGQNKWNIWTTPPPHFNDAKMARFALRASSSLLRGGGGLIVPFYTVQDCRSIPSKTECLPFSPKIRTF